MNTWLYTANISIYRVEQAFEQPTVAWPMNTRVALGDCLCMYLSAPLKRIAYVAQVVDIHLPADSERIRQLTQPYLITQSANTQPSGQQPLPQTKATKPFMLLGNILSLKADQAENLSFQNLKEHGLRGALMGPRKLNNNPELLQYIESQIGTKSIG